MEPRQQKLLDSILTKLTNETAMSEQQRQPTLREKAHAINHALGSKAIEYLQSVGMEIVQRQEFNEKSEDGAEQCTFVIVYRVGDRNKTSV